MSQLIEIINKTKETLQAGWTKGAFARDEKGVATSYSDKKACKFCLLGAIYRSTMSVANLRETDLHLQVMAALYKELSDIKYLGVFNDACETVDPILEVLDKIAASLKINE